MKKKTLRPGERIRVLVVDDSAVIRRLVTMALSSDPLIEVVGTAANGLTALARIAQLNPDLVTLDVEMPEMDGLTALREIQKIRPDLPLIMLSTLTQRGCAVTLDALSLGAADYVTKPSELSPDSSIQFLQSQLLPRIRQFFQTAGATAMFTPQERSMRRSLPARVLAIGVSTGGPAALAKILPEFPKHFAVPILIVQHMPKMFTRLLAERLNAACPLLVSEAVEGDEIKAGRVLIAPGDFHMTAVLNAAATPVVHLTQSPPENSCRPAADVLFRSVADTYGGASIGVILTGMGQDGALGLRAMRGQGAKIIAQDEATSVVWGMPGEVVRQQLADRVVPLEKVYDEVSTTLTMRSGAA